MSSLLFPLLVTLLTLGSTEPSHSTSFGNTNMNFVGAKAGEDVNFDCTTPGAVGNVCLWHTDARYGNESKLIPSKGKLTQSGSNFTLLDISLSEYGIYKCKTVKQGVETTIKEFKLFLVSYEPSVKITHLTQGIATGDPANLTCHTTHKKPVWYKIVIHPNQGSYELIEMPIADRHAVTLLSDDDKYHFQSTLTFKHARKSDGGLYVCKIDNKHIAYARLIVRDSQPPRIIAMSPGPYVQLSQGDNITLNCVVKGFPKPQVIWLKGASHLTLCNERKGSGCAGSPRYFKSGSNGLKIKSIRYTKDNGVFTCLATSYVGTTSDVINVDVTVAPKMGNNINIYVRRNRGSVKLECNVKYSNPPPSFTWRYSLKPDGPWRSITNGISQKGLRSVLHFAAGTTLPPILYLECEASNQEGDSFMKYELYNV